MKESLKFLALIVNINLILQTDNKLYPKIYLDECFYEFSTKNLTLDENGNDNENENENKNENENVNENENKQKKIFLAIYKNELLSI